MLLECSQNGIYTKVFHFMTHFISDECSKYCSPPVSSPNSATFFFNVGACILVHSLDLGPDCVFSPSTASWASMCGMTDLPLREPLSLQGFLIHLLNICWSNNFYCQIFCLISLQPLHVGPSVKGAFFVLFCCKSVFMRT